tara:strand:- start:281 stop:913 length:633 start_codon:yes stop_codon:yes gene_type:complete
MTEKIDKPINRIIQNMRRKNKKFDRYMKQKEDKKIIRIQPKLPTMKKGSSVSIKPVGMVLKVEKKLAGGLAGKAIRGAVRSKPGKKLFKGIKSKLKKMYAKGNETRSESDKKMLKGLFKVDLKRTKSEVLKDMMKFLYKSGKKAPRGSGPRLAASEGLKSYRKLKKYQRQIGKQGEAILLRKQKGVKLNSKGGMQKFNQGGLADYYKDIL